MISSPFARSSRYFACLGMAILALGPCNAFAANSEVWISALPTINGTGTAAHPYDGSTPAKFDAVMGSFQATPNLTIHLGAGTFRSNITTPNRWSVRQGWTIQGAGMYATTCQIMGVLTGVRGDAEFFKTPFDVSTDNVTIQDLTVDCNWAELSLTADMGAGGEKYCAIYAVDLTGSNNLIQRVRHINARGSGANGNESFGIRLAAPKTGDATGNTIRYCRAELPQGNHDAPFALHGILNGNTTCFITNSAFYGNYAIGLNDGQPSTGFDSGGVNAAFIKNCRIHDNTFIDCISIYYQDTGSADGIQVMNNKLVRGWIGVAFVASPQSSTKQNIGIAGNSINLQNRVGNWSSYGINISGSASSNCSITGNYFSFDANGPGYKQFQSIVVSQNTNSSISKNTADETAGGQSLAQPITANVSGTNIQISQNRTVTGQSMTGLTDNFAQIQTPGKTLNFSTRATVGTGENTLIDGFVITGSAPKKVLVRVLGPSLTQYGVQNALSNPTLTLYDHNGAVLTSNDNWQDAQQTEIAATGFQPSNNLESAIVQTLQPGLYTAAANGKNGANGVCLIEIYDLDKTTNSTLGNVSTRGLVGTGDNVVIGGFIVGSGSNPAVLALGIGPSMAGQGIHNPVSDPVLELHDGNGGLIAENNDWKDTQQELIAGTNFQPSDDREAGILTWLSPGNYTAILRGNNGTTGVGLLEIFRMN